MKTNVLVWKPYKKSCEPLCVPHEGRLRNEKTEQDRLMEREKKERRLEHREAKI